MFFTMTCSASIQVSVDGDTAGQYLCVMCFDLGGMFFSEILVLKCLKY